MVFLGFVAFMDPLKETAGESLELLRQAGVKLKVLTGDNEIVTGKICQQLGFQVSQFRRGRKYDDTVGHITRTIEVEPINIVPSSEIENMNDDALAQGCRASRYLHKGSSAVREISAQQGCLSKRKRSSRKGTSWHALLPPRFGADKNERRDSQGHQADAGSKTCQYGVRFSTLPAEARSAIEVFVEKKSQVSTSRR